MTRTCWLFFSSRSPFNRSWLDKNNSSIWLFTQTHNICYIFSTI